MKDTTKYKLGLLAAAGVGAILLWRDSKKEESSGGLGTGSGGTRTDASLDACNLDMRSLNDRSIAKVGRVIMEEIARVGEDWRTTSELEDKVFTVTRAVTARLCPRWPIPDAHHQLANFLETGTEKFREWWQYIDGGVRYQLGAVVS
jgi:hypothetical protein